MATEVAKKESTAIAMASQFEGFRVGLGFEGNHLTRYGSTVFTHTCTTQSTSE